MQLKDLVAVLGFFVLVICLLMLYSLEMEKAKCDHIEIGPISHNLPLDIK